MTDVASVWHELGSATDIVNVWNKIIDSDNYLGHGFFWNQGVPDQSIGKVGGQPNGTTCWHAICYGWTNLGSTSQVVNNLVAFHAYGLGSAPSSITSLSGASVFHFADGVFFNVFPLMNRGF